MVKRDNSLIFCGWEGVYSFSLKTREIRVEYSIGAKGTIYSMSADANKGLWLGAQDNTIIYLDSCFNQSGVYKIGDGRNLVEHICFGNNNDLWIALMGGGLGHFEPETGKTEIFTTADGLPNNTLYSILKDKRGNLWISTNKGLSLFNPQTRIFSNFGKSEGLHIEEFNSDAFFKSPDDELFFGGVGGMVSFYPDSMYNRSNVYSTGKIVITDFKVSGFDRLFQKAVYELDTFLLQKGDNNIQLTFACLDFLNGEKIKYRYRMEEEDDNWVETNYRHRNVNYSNLLPGTYHFEVQCTNPNGEWTMSKKLLVQIPFFYYQTQWFRAMVVLIVLSLMLFTVGLVVRQIRLQANQKQNELKLESLRGQMNPHFIFNALNSVNYFISNNDKVSANSYIADFSRLIRSVLNNLSYDFIPLETELESVNDYLRLEHLRFSDKFNFETEIEINNVSQISVFPGLVQPFIENAIWHGVRGLEDRKGLIKVTFKPENSNMIRCIVEDDGIGRKQAEVYKNILPGRKSQGIRIVEERLKIISDIKKTLYNVVIDDINPGEQETGTRVVIDLPIQTNSVN
jgi:sensor histidine kinase YesM